MSMVFQFLESRRLLSVAGASSTALVPAQVYIRSDQENWTIVADDGGSLLVNVATSRQYLVPVMKADGSVSITGTAEADVISVEAVQGINDAAANGQTNPDFDFVQFAGSNGITSVVASAFDNPHIQASLDHENSVLTERQTNLVNAIAAGSDQGTIDSLKSSINLSKTLIQTYTTAIAKSTTANFVRYHFDTAYDYYVESSLVKSTAKINIDGGAGRDEIVVANTVPMKTSISGGAGADRILSGKKTTLIYGGGGNDVLVSRSTKGGTLHGGKGADRYFGRFGQVNIVARNDGDQVVSANKGYLVPLPGVFFVGDETTSAYFLVTSTSNKIVFA